MGRTSAKYDAFLSYNRQLDRVLAPALQTGVERFAKRWYRPRALRVFRDDASLTANPGLWPSIETALASSAWLVLMASPPAARSPWVNREVAWWREHKSPQRILVVLTEGEFAWDDDTPPVHDPAGVEAGLSPFALVVVGVTVVVAVGGTAVLGAAEPVAADVEPLGPGVLVSRVPVPGTFVFVVRGGIGTTGEVMSNEYTTVFCPGSSVHDGWTSPGPVGLPLASRRMICAVKSLPMVVVAGPG